MWSEFWVALSLVLVIEGLIPALSPRFFRKTLFTMAQLDSRSIRISGLTSMALGAIILYLLRH
jgi:uncharacterized protein YjeT (DUF2065 family)